MNRPVMPDSSGAIVLQPARRYRAVLLVNGQCALEDVEEALERAGFEGGTLASSPPAAWDRNRPRDWPDEPHAEVCANECLVRISGTFRGPARVMRRDMPIHRGDEDTGAILTFAACWEHAPSVQEDTGAAAPAPGSHKPTGSDARGTAILVSAAALLGIGIFANIRSEKRAEQENARLRAAIEREERAALNDRVAELVRHGRSREEASAIAHEELSAQSLVTFEVTESEGV